MSAERENTPQGEGDRAQDEQAVHASGAAGPDDQAHRTAPPGNPETDREAVEKGEENIGRVAGR